MLRVFAVHRRDDLNGHLSYYPEFIDKLTDNPEFIDKLTDIASLVDAYELYQKLTHSIKHNFIRGTNNANWSPDACADDKWIFKQIPETGIFLFGMITRLGTSDRMEGVSESTKNFLVSLHIIDKRIFKFVIWDFYINERDTPINPIWSAGIDPVVPFNTVKELVSSERTNCHASIVQDWQDLKY